MRTLRLSVAALAVTTILVAAHIVQRADLVTVAAVSDNPVTTTVPATIAPTSTVDPAAVAAFLVAWDSATTTVPPTTQPAPTTTVRRAPSPRAPTSQPSPVQSGDAAFLACVKARESRGNPRAVNPSSGAGGYYQYLRSTWANLGYHIRYGVPGAELAAPWQQDEAAIDTLHRVGRSPWAGPGC